MSSSGHESIWSTNAQNYLYDREDSERMLYFDPTNTTFTARTSTGQSQAELQFVGGDASYSDAHGLWLFKPDSFTDETGLTMPELIIVNCPPPAAQPSSHSHLRKSVRTDCQALLWFSESGQWRAESKQITLPRHPSKGGSNFPVDLHNDNIIEPSEHMKDSLLRATRLSDICHQGAESDDGTMTCFSWDHKTNHATNQEWYASPRSKDAGPAHIAFPAKVMTFSPMNDTDDGSDLEFHLKSHRKGILKRQ